MRTTGDLRGRSGRRSDTLIVFALSGALVSALLLFPAPSHAVSEGQRNPKPDARCPVCGMFVARHPYWIATIVFREGTSFYFDGPKDMFAFYLAPEAYERDRRSEDVEFVFVTDYYTLRSLDAREAWFVIGSDVLGPMGRELVPFADEASARTFLADHGGTRIFRFHEIGEPELDLLR